MRFLLISLLLSFLFSCMHGTEKFSRFPAGQGFTNPVFDPGFPFADPGILRASDGNYYSYATQSRLQGKRENVPCAKSRDLVHWEKLPDCMPEKPEWANRRQNFWAPHVSEFEGKFLMYISAEQNEWGYCVAVGLSEKPEGPFREFKRLACGESFDNIDPMAFADPVSGKKYLYWGSASKPIYVQELSSDGLSFQKDSVKTEVLKAIREPRGGIKDADGFTYFFGTQIGPAPFGKYNVQAARTKDFQTIELLPEAFPRRPDWAHGVADHYTPQTVKNNDGTFGMYLVIAHENGESCISLGKSKKIAGPYEEFQKLDCTKNYKLINPLLTKDDEGRKYLYWEKPNDLSVYYRELDESGKSFISGLTESKDPPSYFRIEPKYYENLIEGAWVTYKNGFYYLYYSGSECCSIRAHYAVSVARSKSPLGPFVRMKDAWKTEHSVILNSSSEWMGPGHNSVIVDGAGQEWMLVHAIPRNNPRIRVSGPDEEPNRMLLLEKINYTVDGWPFIEDGRPHSQVPESPSN